MIIFWIKLVGMDIAIIQRVGQVIFGVKVKPLFTYKTDKKDPPTCRVDQQKRLVVDF